MSAQLEDGYTRTANELLERLMKIKLNGTQHNIVYCIIRNTYGFQRKSHAMSLTFISTAIEAHKDLVKRDLDKLIECNIVKVFKDGDYTHSREIGINKNVDEWVTYSKPIGRQSTNQSTVSESVYLQSTNQSIPTVDQSVYQERKVFKESIKEISTTTENPFRLFESEGFGTISATIGEKLGHMIDEYGDRWVCEAMKIAVYRGKRSLGYVDGILKSFQSSGVDQPWLIEQPEFKPTLVKPNKKGDPDWDKILKQMGGDDSGQNRGA